MMFERLQTRSLPLGGGVGVGGVVQCTPLARITQRKWGAFHSGAKASCANAPPPCPPPKGGGVRVLQARGPNHV